MGGAAGFPGDLIARLDPGDYELKVRELDALAAQARAGFQKMRADHDRVLALYEVDSMSKSDLDQARGGFESAAAQLEAVSSGLDQAHRQLSYTRLYTTMAWWSVQACPWRIFKPFRLGFPWRS